MTRIALPLSLAGAALLGACGMMQTEPKTAAKMDTVATQEIPYRAGAGVVQSVTPAPGSTASTSATGTKPRAATPGTPTISSAPAAKPSTATPGASSASAGATGMYRLGIRMEDGRTQYVDMMGPDVPTAGTRVRLTPDKQLVRE